MLLLLTWTKFSDFCIFLFYRVLILAIITVLEIPIEVTVTMKYSPDNKDAMVKYEDLVGKHYKEPVDGKYEDITPEILEGLESDTDEETELD